MGCWGKFLDYTETHLEDGDHITNINNTIQRAKGKIHDALL